MSLFSSYRTDGSASNDGAWQVGKLRGDIDVKVRSTHSKVAKEAQRAIDKRNRPFHLSGEPIPESVAAQNEADIACAVTIDWRGADMVDEDGNAIPCTEETKRRIFEDPEMWEFRQQIIGLAANAENFRKVVLAAALGNSSLRSVPSSGQAETSGS